MNVLSNQVVDPLQIYKHSKNNESRIYTLEQGGSSGAPRASMPNALSKYIAGGKATFNVPGMKATAYFTYEMIIPGVDFSNPAALKLKDPKRFESFEPRVYVWFESTAGTYTYTQNSLYATIPLYWQFDNPGVQALFDGLNMSIYNFSPGGTPAPAVGQCPQVSRTNGPTISFGHSNPTQTVNFQIGYAAPDFGSPPKTPLFNVVVMYKDATATKTIPALNTWDLGTKNQMFTPANFTGSIRTLLR
ncbi:MAG: hypothetical protein RR733_04920 [Victivallaceae bacterium]